MNQDNTPFEIVRDYHFYAAHRNHTLLDKCRNLHGHTYYVKVHLHSHKTANGVSLLFADIDRQLEPIFKRLDHGLLICSEDPLLRHLARFMEEEGEELKMIVLGEESSVENLLLWIKDAINKHTNLPVHRISLQETTSAVVALDF